MCFFLLLRLNVNRLDILSHVFQSISNLHRSSCLSNQSPVFSPLTSWSIEKRVKYFFFHLEKNVWICQISDHPSSFGVLYRTIEFPTSVWIKYPIPWCWNTFLCDNNFGAGKKESSRQIDGTLGLPPKRHIALLHLLFQTEIGEEDMLWDSYWILETKQETEKYCPEQ